MTIQTTIIRDVAIVNLGITIWSGSKKLEASDFINVDAGDLPPANAVSYGIKHLIDKERLQPFKNLKAKAERLCLRYGTRFLNGCYAIPQECIATVGAEMDAICQQFEEERDNFLSDYDTAIEEWIASNPGFEAPLRRAIIPRAMVSDKFRARYAIFEISASPFDQRNTLVEAENDLFESVLGGVVTSAMSLTEDKKPDDSWRSPVRQTIADLGNKLVRFSFMDATGGMKGLGKKLLSFSEANGNIKDAEYRELYGLLKPLKDTTAVRKAIEKHVGYIPDSIQKTTDMFDGAIQPQPAGASAAVQTTATAIVTKSANTKAPVEVASPVGQAVSDAAATETVPVVDDMGFDPAIFAEEDDKSEATGDDGEVNFAFPDLSDTAEDDGLKPMVFSW